MTLREVTEQLDNLSPYAALAVHSKGRLRPMEPCAIRTCYQRDVDRIVHSKAFRRLMHKTQVFLQPEGDHYRTRMTHTLEVARIARTIARGLRLNEDLTEAIALGHDLGHTPFGHAGERVLNQILSGGFHHNQQSLRVVDRLEREGEGLNLCYEVRRGILCHTGPDQAETLEGQIVRLADKIAYINHDIDDAIRAGILQAGDLPRELTAILGDTHSQRISTMVNAVIAYGTDGDIGMTEPHWEATMALRKFMFENVYFNSAAKSEDSKVADMIEHIYEYFLKQPEKLPPEYRANIDADGVERSICDYIACMTDRYALALFEELFVPKTWQHK